MRAQTVRCIQCHPTLLRLEAHSLQRGHGLRPHRGGTPPRPHSRPTGSARSESPGGGSPGGGGGSPGGGGSSGGGGSDIRTKRILPNRSTMHRASRPLRSCQRARRSRFQTSHGQNSGTTKSKEVRRLGFMRPSMRRPPACRTGALPSAVITGMEQGTGPSLSSGQHHGAAFPEDRDQDGRR